MKYRVGSEELGFGKWGLGSVGLPKKKQAKVQNGTLFTKKIPSKPVDQRVRAKKTKNGRKQKQINGKYKHAPSSTRK